jgi:hypothetical protein
MMPGDASLRLDELPLDDDPVVARRRLFIALQAVNILTRENDELRQQLRRLLPLDERLSTFSTL